MTLVTDLEEALDQLAADSLTRRRRQLDSPCGSHITVDGQPLLAFASNDYLGLANHPELKAALREGCERWGTGSGASPVVSGHLAPHDKLEKRLAEFVAFPRTLSFSTGYMANLAVLPTLAGRGSAIFADKLNHASLIDAVQLSAAHGAQSQRYPHTDLEILQSQLIRSNARQKFIVTDAVFSMDGDIAPLPDLLALAEHHDTWLVVDDAHGFGILGPHGEGSLAHFGLQANPRIILTGTLGKAAGVAGAFVAASEEVIEYLLQKARSYLFSTAAPPALASALCASLDLIAGADERRATLRTHAAQLCTGLAALPWQHPATSTAIQPLLVGDNQAALHLSSRLWEKGIWVPAIRPPTVPKGTARLRISLSAAHNQSDIAQLIDTLKQLACTSH